LWIYLCDFWPGKTWSDLKAWSELTNTKLSPVEYNIMWKMTIAYIDQIQKSSDVSCPSPVVNKLDPDDICKKTHEVFKRLT